VHIFIALKDKKYYPTAEEVFGPEVEVRASKCILLSQQPAEWHLNNMSLARNVKKVCTCDNRII